MLSARSPGCAGQACCSALQGSAASAAARLRVHHVCHVKDAHNLLVQVHSQAQPGARRRCFLRLLATKAKVVEAGGKLGAALPAVGAVGPRPLRAAASSCRTRLPDSGVVIARAGGGRWPCCLARRQRCCCGCCGAGLAHASARARVLGLLAAGHAHRRVWRLFAGHVPDNAVLQSKGRARPERRVVACVTRHSAHLR
jgi:hypothetical protein